MDSTQLLRELQEEFKCPICIEILKEPVTTNCGHNFCLRCISQVRETSENTLPCPLCKESVNRTFLRNKLLGNLAEKIQVTGKKASEEQIQVQPQDMGQKDKEVVEEKNQVEGMIDACKARVHQERLKTQEEFNRMRKNLEEEESFLLARQKHMEEEESILLARQKQIEEEKRFLLARKKQIEEEESFFLARWKDLEEKESSLLAREKKLGEKESSLLARQKKLEEEQLSQGRLLWLEQEGDKSKEQHNIEISEQLSPFRKLKQDMPPGDLLQDMGDNSNRRQGFQFTNPTPVPVDRINEATSRNESTIVIMKKITGCQSGENNAEPPTSEIAPLESHSNAYQGLPFMFGEFQPPPLDERKTKSKRRKRSRSRHSVKAENMESWSCLSEENKGLVTLNPESADPELTLSQDLKTVALQPLPGGSGNKQAKPRPFDLYHWVLGSQGLSSGHLVWEVKLQGTDKGECVVGVATELCPGQHCLKHIWALRVSAWDCQPVTESSTRQNIPIILRKVGIHLDLDHGKLVFFNPDSNKHIYTFQESFTGQVFPFLGLINPGSQITLIP